MDMDIIFFIKICIDMKLVCSCTDVTESSLCRLAHNFTQFTSENQFAFPTVIGDLNGQRVSADCCVRSEERRVGSECRWRGGSCGGIDKGKVFGEATGAGQAQEP